MQRRLINVSLKTSKEKLMFRPFTEDTKMLILIFMNDRRLTLGQMVFMLNRNETDLRNKVKAIQAGGEFHRIHLDLTEYEGLYALKKARGDFNNGKITALI